MKPFQFSLWQLMLLPIPIAAVLALAEYLPLVLFSPLSLMVLCYWLNERRASSGRKG